MWTSQLHVSKQDGERRPNDQEILASVGRGVNLSYPLAKLQSDQAITEFKYIDYVDHVNVTNMQ